MNTPFDLARAFDSINHAKLAEALARHDLDLFASLTAQSGAGPAPLHAAWAPEVIRHLSAGQIVTAIKLLREKVPGTGLLEAKLCCDFLRNGTTFTDRHSDVVADVQSLVSKFGTLRPTAQPPAPPPPLKVHIVRDDDDRIVGVYASAMAASCKRDEGRDFYVTTEFVR